MKIPNNINELLYLVKSKTESHWKIISEKEWLYDAQWTGLNDLEIDNIEKKHNVFFSEDHRSFLKVLHTVDKRFPVEYYDSKGVLKTQMKFPYINWIKEDDIKEKIEWPYINLLNDVKKGYWCEEDWGKRPKHLQESISIFEKKIEKSPKLLPIGGSSYIVNISEEFNYPILSVQNSDIIVRGWSYKMWILGILIEELGLFDEVFEIETNIGKMKMNLTEINDNLWRMYEKKEIPFWSKIIRSMSPNFSYFGDE